MAGTKDETSQEIQEVYSALGLANHSWLYPDRPDTSTVPQKPAPEFQIVLSQNAFPPPLRSR